MPRLAPGHPLEPTGIRDLIPGREPRHLPHLLRHPCHTPTERGQRATSAGAQVAIGDGTGIGAQRRCAQAQQGALSRSIRPQEHGPPGRQRIAEIT